MTDNVIPIETVTAKSLVKSRDFVTADTLSALVGHFKASTRRAVSDLIAYDQFKGCVVCRRDMPFKGGDAGRWTDVHDVMLAVWASGDAGGRLKVGFSELQRAVIAIAQTNAFHPVAEYLDGLPPWDGTARLDGWLSACFGAEDTALTRAYAAKTLIGAVARIRVPGCKVDTMLVLESKQGKRKSATLKALVPDESWFLDSRIDISDKDSFQITRGKWIVEFPELDSLRGKEKTLVRAWLSSATNTFRPSYGKHEIDSKRQFIPIGTTNEAEYLEEYERRIWPVACSEKSDTGWVEANRDHLWAEALRRYNAGEQWWLDESLDTESKDSTRGRVRSDASDSIVREWMQSCGREIDGVTTAEVLMSALGFEKSKLSSGTNMCKQLMRRLGYEHDKTMVTRKMTVYLPAKRDRFWRNSTAVKRCKHGKLETEPCTTCELGLGDEAS